MSDWDFDALLAEALAIRERQFGPAKNEEHASGRSADISQLLRVAAGQIDRLGTGWASAQVAESKSAIDNHACMLAPTLDPDGVDIHWPTLEFLLSKRGAQ